jgi:hypothetical protein
VVDGPVRDDDRGQVEEGDAESSLVLEEEVRLPGIEEEPRASALREQGEPGLPTEVPVDQCAVLDEDRDPYSTPR